MIGRKARARFSVRSPATSYLRVSCYCNTRVVIAQGTLMQRYALPVPTTVSALLLAAILLALLPGTAVQAAGAVAGAEAVEFREGDLTLKGMLFRPEGSGPFPAVIAMHNCAGLINPSGGMRTRYRDWAQQLVKMGMSFTSGTPEDLKQHLDRETAKWAPIIKDANITLQ